MGRARHICGLVGAVAAVVGGTAMAATTSWAATSAPAMTVDPATALTDGARVTVTASGLPPRSFAMAVQCVAAVDLFFDDCDSSDVAYGDVDAAGTVTLSLRVDALLATGAADGRLGETDCRAEGACSIGLMLDDEEVLTAPISFDPHAPLAPPPTVTVTPDEGLDDYQQVRVEAEGLVWSDQAVVFECAAADPLTESDCDAGSARWIELTDGAASLDYQPSVVIETDGQELVDCRAPGACVVAVSPSWTLSSPAKIAVAPVSFDPGGPVAVPSLAVTPDAGLVDGQTVTAAGSGFRPGGFVEFLVCTTDPSWETCQWADSFAEVDGTGSFSAEVEIGAVVPTATGEVDCRTDAGGCVLVATPTSPDSVRAARAPLAFDPDAPLLPGPAITVEPSTDLPDEGAVSVAGTGFRPNGSAIVEVCRAGDVEACDGQGPTFAQPDGGGAFTVDIDVAAAFEGWNGQEVDCRAAPGCAVVATDLERNRRATAPLSFAPPGGARHRYLDPVFDAVDVTRDVVYRDTLDSQGHPVQLTLDVYEPAGDTAEVRPAVVWMPGGWFGSDPDQEGQADMVAYAEAFARRGYVAVVADYRQRPELHCCPTTDAPGITAALADGREDAIAGIEWLRDHASDYRIDPGAIAAGGASAGAANTYGLAYPSGHAGPDDGGAHAVAVSTPPAASEPLIAAALPISGVSAGAPAAGAPPVLAFHGGEDLTAPQHLSEWTCTDAHAAGGRCDVVSYPGEYGDIVNSRQRDIIRRSSDFLAEVVLGPRGYLDGPAPEPTTTTTAPATTTTTPTSAPTTSGSTTHTTGRGGSLPRTGSDGTSALVRIGVGLTLAGVGLAYLSRVRRRTLAPAAVGDDGRVTLVAAVAVVALGAALTVPNGALAAPAAPVASGQEVGGTPASTTGTTLPPDDTTSTVVEGDTPTTLDATTTSTGATTTTTADDAGTTTTTIGDAGDQDDGTGHPPPDPSVAPEDDHGGSGDFPEDWSPDQVAYAHALIDRTETTLPRFANPAILPLLGYTWILDGTEPDGFQHWVNLGWFDDGHVLDPEFPESVVFRNGTGGRTLEAAMFILPWGHDMTNIPEDIAWLPGWHTHTNLCFDSRGRLTGLAHDGVCDVGFLVIPPPMLHVWLHDTPCGRFAGVDEHGIMCDHDHEPMSG